MVFLVEEPSMEALLQQLLPGRIPEDVTYEIHAFQGKDDLIHKLDSRLRSYAKWLPEDWHIIVLVDRNGDDCLGLKQKLEDKASSAGLVSRSQTANRAWQLVNRIVIEELRHGISATPKRYARLTRESH